MKREEFGVLFNEALETAASNIEKIRKIQIPRNFMIEFHGICYDEPLIDVNLALDCLYLEENLFVFLVDVAVLEATSEVTKVFVRVSSFPHVASIEQTAEYRYGTGPFHQLISWHFKVIP